MHLTVGYLATPTGDDGVALASALAKTFDAERRRRPGGPRGTARRPSRAAPSISSCWSNRGEEWVSRAVAALADRGVTAGSTVLVGESFAESLIGFAEEKDSDLIVVGGARDGFFGGHAIGPVTGALLHSSPIPVALAPRGYAEDPDDAVTAVTAAVPTRPGDDNPLPFAITLASAAGPADPDAVAGVGREPGRGRAAPSEVRQLQVAAAEENLVVAARALPDAPEIESLVADGMTLESALKKLNWDDADLLVVGLQQVRRAAADLPRLDGRAHPRRHRRPGDRRARATRVDGAIFSAASAPPVGIRRDRCTRRLISCWIRVRIKRREKALQRFLNERQRSNRNERNTVCGGRPIDRRDGEGVPDRDRRSRSRQAARRGGQGAPGVVARHRRSPSAPH